MAKSKIPASAKKFANTALNKVAAERKKATKNFINKSLNKIAAAKKKK